MGTSTINRGRLSPESASPFEWLRIWIGALTHPSVAYYKRLAAKAPASTKQAYRWIAFAFSIYTILYMLKDSPFGGFSLVLLIIMVTIVTPVSLIFTIVQLRILDWFARGLGGRGQLITYTFTYAAFAAPLIILEGLFFYLFSPSQLSCLYMLLLLLLLLYEFLLNVIAMKAVYKLSWGIAVFSYCLPIFFIFLLRVIIMGLILITLTQFM
jgi:hypothetical protein